MRSKKRKDDWLPDDEPPIREHDEADANRAKAHTIATEAIRVALLQTGRIQLWLNSVGFDDRVKRPYGLGKGSADQIGQLVTLARFCGFETKTGKARLSHEQRLWHAEAKRNGAFVCVVHTPAEAITALERARRFDVHVSERGELAIKWRFFE